MSAKYVQELLRLEILFAEDILREADGGKKFPGVRLDEMRLWLKQAKESVSKGVIDEREMEAERVGG